MNRMVASVPPLARSQRDWMPILLLVLFTAKLAVSLGIVNRGIEMGDEGFFLLNLNRPESAVPYMEIYRFLATLHGGYEISLMQARVLRIAVELAGSLALIAGVFVWVRRLVPDTGSGGLAFAAICLQGTLITAASRSFGYNDMTSFFSYTAVGCLFGVAAAPAGYDLRRMACAFGAGALIAFQLTVKFPTAIVLFVVGCAPLMIVAGSLSRRSRVRLYVSYLTAFVATLALVVMVTGGLEVHIDRIGVAAQIQDLTGYSIAVILSRYVEYDIWTVRHLFLFWAVFAVGCFLSMWWRRGGAGRALVPAFAVAAPVALWAVLHSHPFFLHWSLVYLACLVVGLAVALLVAGGVRGPASFTTKPAAERLLLLMVLLLLPGIAIAGTNVPVTLRLPTHVLPLFVLVAALVFERGTASHVVNFRRLVSITLAVVTGVVFVQHHVLRPYGLREPIYAQRSILREVPGLRVDPATRTFLEGVAETFATAGFRRGDPVIAFDFMPGLVHFLGGTSPRYNIYIFDKADFNCFNLNQVRFERPPFLVLAQPMPPEQQRCLESIRFPDDYELRQTLRNPYEPVYAGFGKPGLSHVYIYGPRAQGLDQGM